MGGEESADDSVCGGGGGGGEWEGYESENFGFYKSNVCGRPGGPHGDAKYAYVFLGDSFNICNV